MLKEVHMRSNRVLMIEMSSSVHLLLRGYYSHEFSNMLEGSIKGL